MAAAKSARLRATIKSWELWRTMSNNRFSIPRSVILLLGGLLASGCFDDPGPIGDDGEEDETGEGDTGEPANCWCATVENEEEEGPEADPPMGAPVAIVDSENNNGHPKACLAATADRHTGLVGLGLDANNEVVVPNNNAFLAPFRDDVFAAAEDRCDMLGDGQQPGSTNDCTSFLVDGTSPIEWDESRMCMDEFPNSEPPAHWSDYYELDVVIEYKTATGVYEIDEDFFNAIRTKPWLISEDSAYIARNGSGDFAFFNVLSGDVTWELGIRTADVPQTLNNYDVTSVAEVAWAYTNLWNETEFELVVNRPGVGTVTLNYEIL